MMTVSRLIALIVFLFGGVFLSYGASQDSADQDRRRHAQENSSHPRSTNWMSENTADYRLTRLEVEVREKSQAIHTELRETNRRLQALEWQNADVHSSLEAFKTELQRFSQQQQQNLQNTYVPIQRENTKLGNRVETLTKGVKIMIAAMRGLNADVTGIRNNISQLVNRTEHIFESNKELLTKQIFNTGLIELKTHQPMVTACSLAGTIASVLPRSCNDVQSAMLPTGVYKIQPEHSAKPIMVFCDMETQGGGWVVVQSRTSGIQDFYLNWSDYKHGFGNLGGDFWLGLENLYALTGHDVNELLIELEDFNLQKAHARYAAFSVGPEVEGFPLKVLGGYSGDAGDSLIYHAGSRFSTKDMDQDSWPEGSCAQAHGGGWWYRSCDTCNLNGRYLSGELPDQYIYQGMYWGEFRGAQYSLLKARMLVRPRDQTSPPMFADNTRNTTLQ